MKLNKFLIIGFLIIIFVLFSLATQKEGLLVGTSGIDKICIKGSHINCYDISYNNPLTGITNHRSAQILPGYFIDASGYLAIVPYGYIASSDLHSYSPIQQISLDTSMNITSYNSTNTSNKKYNSDNYDITYHADPLSTTQPDESTAGVGKMWVEISGNLVSIPYTDVSNTTLYYQPGTYTYNSASYVPNYEESVFLSKLTNKPTTTDVIDKNQSDFCRDTQSSIIEQDSKCNAIGINKCNSASCCVLLGGEKCVAGNQSGPSIKSNYSDHTIINRDYYYYRGQCYGHCI